MKAIILTHAEVNPAERKLLKETKVFKLALNHHAKEYSPDERIITDYILPKIVRDFPEKIVSVRQRLREISVKVKYPEIEFKGTTIVSAVEYLISEGYDEILIVGDNSVNTTEFQNLVNEEIAKIISKHFPPFSIHTPSFTPFTPTHIVQDLAQLRIYQYKNGNFRLPVKSIAEFLQPEGMEKPKK